ncbi:hypothetical protein SKTS_06320 [Sulfurimicrobium lacus]|uniref:Diguanylate cyclase n=2 Tax=Sulfurimicrobium lacus TaxID=2715678 RepID=A0A6F8V9R9_9PROT|nr:hypothetical protein SKTS_06320 [Sulfurimicrobium lacus]
MLGLIGVFLNGLKQSYDEKLARATTDSQNMARVLEEQINSVIQKTDVLLQHAAGDVILKPDDKHAAEATHAYLKKLKSSIPEIFRMRVIQPDGYSLASSLEEKTSRPFYGDRAYFIRHRDNPSLGLDISEPIEGRTHHGWQVMLSRRLNYADGSFAGIVSSGIALSYFEDFFSTLNLGKNSNITLLSKDLHVITRFPLSEGQRMKSVRGGPIAAALQINPVKGTITGKSSVDGTERIFSYRQVGDLPLVVVVGLSKQDVLAEWRRNALIDSAVMLGLLVAVGWLSFNLMQHYRKEQESKNQLREITSTLGEGVYVLDGNGKVTFVNPEAERLLGWTREELIGRNGHETFHYERMDGTPIPAHSCPIHNTIVTGQTYRALDDNLVRKDGTTIPVSITSSPIVRDGKIVGSVASFQDISERKLAMATQDRLERNQRALLDAARESALLLERNGTILAINEVGAKRLRGTPSELLGKNIFDLMPPEVANVRRERLEKTAQNGLPNILEDERNGMRMVNSLYPVIDMDGKIDRVAVYSTDVTEQRLLEAIENLFSAINQKVLRGETLDGILEFICTQVVQLFNLDMAWLGRKEPDGTVSILSFSGSAKELAQRLSAAMVRWDYNPRGLCPTGASIRTEQTLTYNCNDPHFQAWAGIACEYELQAILAIPLTVHGEIYGAFTLCSRDSTSFANPTIVNRLVGIVNRIAIVLEMGMDQQQLRLLGMALGSAANAVMVTDHEGHIQWANAAFSRLSGYSEEEIIGQSPKILKSGQQDKAYYQALWQTINNGEVWSSETVERNKDGSLYTVMQTITPLTDATGKITHFIAIHEDITDLKRTQERISHQAQYDGLTDLPNRALFYDRLRQALSLAKRSKVGLALMFLDLDRFKQVNDTLGHHIGDLLLKSVAERLRQCVRESDTVARLGGDEFTVLLYDLRKREDIGRIAEKIIRTVSLPYELDGHDVRIGVSIGIARFSDDTEDEDSLVNLADKAMYSAKAGGRNTYRFCAS